MRKDILSYFDNYCNIGLSPIVVNFMSKKPVLAGWNENYSQKRWRSILCRDERDFNIAILLGRVVDVEADSEEGNELLQSLIGDSKHPCFRSSRSVHHLFLNPDPSLTMKVYHGIEFRGNKVCSVMPPSVHEDGTEYRFLKSSQFPIPQMPDDLLRFYWGNRKAEMDLASPRKPAKPKVKKDHKKLACPECKKTVYIHKKRLVLEVRSFSQKGMFWSCRSCRTIDVRESCRTIRSQTAKE